MIYLLFDIIYFTDYPINFGIWADECKNYEGEEVEVWTPWILTLREGNNW
jgi:hypothetical protein